MKKLKFKKSLKPQAPSLTGDLGSCRMILMSSFGGFPDDKFAKPPQQSKEKMKEINYKNKTIKLPWKLANTEVSTELVTRQNPFSGQSIQLPEFAAVIYDKTIELNLKAERKDSATGQPPGISEHQDDWQLVRNGLDWFRQHFAREYMVLLD